MTNVWGLGDDGGCSDIANINSRLNSKVDRNGDEMHGDLRCLLYTSPSPRDRTRSRMPSSA